ncbi:hypothetical protein HDU86_006570 [Geranomyces michiganensis]|nr:hypothetical protein HDU86_006570 [Geranomyces michiganensis]
MITSYLELAVASLLTTFAKRPVDPMQTIFTRRAVFERLEPKFTITAQDLGESGAIFPIEYTRDGEGRFPHLTWERSELPVKTKQLLMIIEDPDVSSSTPAVHGLFLNISADATALPPSCIQAPHPFTPGRTLRGPVYIPPAPLLNTGAHNYVYQLVALSEPIELKEGKAASREDVEAAIAGKVAGYGIWVGRCSRTWKGGVVLNQDLSN